jgi:Ca-activated chloride channel family protein
LKTLFTIFLFIALLVDPVTIGKINSLKQEAKKAYLKGDFKTAISKYRYLIDSLQVQEDEVTLNLANAYFSLNDTTNATREYQSLTRSSKNHIRSKAQQQLGVLLNRQGKLEEAMNSFKESLKSDPANEGARYNYQLVKRKLEEQKKKEQQNQNQEKDKQQQDEDKSKEPSAFAKRLKAQADALAAQYKFKEAYTLMNDGLKKDPTVSHYNDFIKRLNDVVTIKK